MKKIIYGVLPIIIMLCLFGCSTKNSAYEMYSREDVNKVCASRSFGKGWLDDIYVALKYTYTSDELNELYGDGFEIKPWHVICYYSEGTRSIKGRSGKAQYGFVIDNKAYVVSLTKNYGEPWIVTESHWDSVDQETLDMIGQEDKQYYENS